jgi:hypothetical protein
MAIGRASPFCARDCRRMADSKSEFADVSTEFAGGINRRHARISRVSFTAPEIALYIAESYWGTGSQQ